MNKQTTTISILAWLLIITCAWLVYAQNEIEKQKEIIEIDKEIWALKEEIIFHQNWYNISMQASEECVESFKKDAEKEHVEADKKRELIKKLEEKKEGLIKNR